jgi:UDP-N-acetylmuramyl pentapeptide synthase
VRLSPQEIAVALGAEIVAEGEPTSPRRATIDSAATGPGDLFFGLRGERRDGGEFAPAAIEAGAWGVVVSLEWRSSFVAQRDTKDERRSPILDEWPIAHPRSSASAGWPSATGC